MSKIDIHIDSLKCTAPQDCRLCLGVCQPATLILTFTDKDFHHPREWKIVPVFPSSCVNCLSCVETCPEQAITVTMH